MDELYPHKCEHCGIGHTTQDGLQLHVSQFHASPVEQSALPVKQSAAPFEQSAPKPSAALSDYYASLATAAQARRRRRRAA